MVSVVSELTDTRSEVNCLSVAQHWWYDRAVYSGSLGRKAAYELFKHLCFWLAYD